MGHTCAPEIMNTLAAVAAGHPDFVLPAYAADPSLIVDVWVDNIRYAGPRDAVIAETVRLDKTAEECHLTWKHEESESASTDYEFIGVRWDHRSGKVSVSRKLRSKLLAVVFEEDSIPAHDLETLGEGCCMHRLFPEYFRVPFGSPSSS